MRYIICLVVAYLTAAPMTSRISLDLTQTEWTHVLTYVWLAGAWIVWGILFFVAFIVFAAFAHGTGTGGRWR